MEATSEISALFTLIDDPDEEVFGAVTSRIVDYGKPIIPNLEHLWETTEDSSIQERIELLIHRLHFSDLKEEFIAWNNSADAPLLAGALLVARFQYPELRSNKVVEEVEKLRRNIWLELNNYLTPLEQVSIISGILYNYAGLKGEENHQTDPNQYLLPKLLESKKGNQLNIGILYLALCQMLDVAVSAIEVPGQFLLGYVNETPMIESGTATPYPVKFVIDPTSGQVYTIKDLKDYLKRIKQHRNRNLLKPLNNQQVIGCLLKEMSQCFEETRSSYKKAELQQIISILEPSL